MDAVCFDLDDTLYDYRQYAEAGLRSAADLLKTRTGESFYEELHDLYFKEEITDETFDRLLNRHDLPGDLVEDLLEAYHSATEPLTAYDEAEDVLAVLEANHRVGLITDGREGNAKLDRLGIRGHFDAILVTPMIGSSKHHQAVFEQVLSALSVLPSNAMYVGDDPRIDFRAPNELGMRTIRLRRGRYTDLEPTDKAAAPDHEIDVLAGVLLHL